jgi:hypothetical protein
MVFLATASQRGLPLVLLILVAYWFLNKRLKSDRPVNDAALTATETRAREALSLSFQMKVRDF